MDRARRRRFPAERFRSPGFGAEISRGCKIVGGGVGWRAARSSLEEQKGETTMSDRKLLPGKFAWYELVTRDAKKAQAFYGEVLGWRVQGFPLGNFTYEM